MALQGPSPPPATGPSRRREIEDVASALFRERGYAATSIRDIARELDIQGATVYAHVASKEDVLWAIVDRTAARFERAAADADADPRAAADPIRRIAELVRGHLRVILEDAGSASVFISEWRALTGSRREAILARRDAYEARFREAIGDGIANGELAMTDPAVAAAYLLNALNGIATWYRPDGRLGPDRIAEHFIDLSLRTLTEDHR